MATAHQVHSKADSAERTVSVDVSPELSSGESVASVAAPTSSPSGLTITGQVVNASTLTINGSSIAAGKAIQFQVSGGTSGVCYEITAVVTTDAADPNVFPVIVELEVT